jgi:tetratricopeptide (TPR) repeat protein
MFISNRTKIVFMLFLFLGMAAFPQDKQANEDKDKKLREEILTVYQTKGELGLRDFIKKSKNQLANKFILDFAAAGITERKEEWLKVCKFVSEEKKDDKLLADTLFSMGEYFLLILEDKSATDYLDKALRIYSKLNDSFGQGNVYLRKGDIFNHSGADARAHEMYDKALFFFEKTGASVGQGDVYLKRGNTYYIKGESLKALEMYEKALFFFESVGNLAGEARVYLGKGLTYSGIGENSRALEMLDKALPFFEKIGEYLDHAYVYFGKGSIYLLEGNYSKAIEMYDKALYFF